MKTTIKFVLACALTTTICNVQAQKDFSEEKIKKMLTAFYTNYIGPNQNKSDSIERTYLTAKLYNYLQTVNNNGLVLDSDPFTKSQMIDQIMLKDIVISKIDNDLYLVNYTYGNGHVLIKLRIVKEKDDYKIDDVFIPITCEYELTKNEWKRN